MRERSAGRWQTRAYVGKGPLTGKKLYVPKTITAAGNRDQREANRWELELRDGELTGEGGTFRKLCAEYLKIGERTMSPSTVRETQGMIDRYLDKPLAMASILLSAGVDPKVAAARGGWVVVATMLHRYAHVLPATDRASAEVMGRVFDGQGAAG